FALVTEQGENLAERFLAMLPTAVQEDQILADRVRSYLTANDEKSLRWQISGLFDEVEGERNRLLEKREELKREMDRLRRRRAELTPEEFERRENDISRNRKEINRLIKTGIDDVAVLKFLTDKGALP